MTWTGIVKDAIEETLGEDADIVILNIEGNRGEIGRASSFEQALENFAEFLDARVVNYWWDFFAEKKTAEIIVNQDDVDINYVNGVPKFTRLYIYGKPDPEIVVSETAKSKETVKMDFQNIKPGCVAENAKYIDVRELKVLLDRKDDVVSALQQKILELETDIGDYIKIVNVLNPDEAERFINGLRLIATVLENECKSRNS